MKKFKNLFISLAVILGALFLIAGKLNSSRIKDSKFGMMKDGKSILNLSIERNGERIYSEFPQDGIEIKDTLLSGLHFRTNSFISPNKDSLSMIHNISVKDEFGQTSSKEIKVFLCRIKEGEIQINELLERITFKDSSGKEFKADECKINKDLLIR